MIRASRFGGFALLVLLVLLGLRRPASAAIPALEARGRATQLIVDGKPFLMLGGELGNSAASSLEYLKPFWSRFAELHLNTLLAPVSWELVEPVEGRFDFSSVDGLLRDARASHMRLVLLWFGSWKNSMSSYVPAWVKRAPERFPRARTPDGAAMEILSPFSESNAAADAKAFAALMAHLKVVDGRQNTVLMVQVENEVGMLPTARDHAPPASARFAEPVPRALIDHLVARRATLAPQLAKSWEASGSKRSGDWQAVFGKGLAAEEAFTAWFLARYVEAVAVAGKAAYPLPMYTNAALNRPGKLPGQYPSGGPLPHLLDVWKAGAPSLDFLSPDVYFPNFSDLVSRYARPDNILFIPEANRASQLEAGANAFFAIGEHAALGFSPFAIDLIGTPSSARLSQAYSVLAELSPLLLEQQSAGRVRGFRPAVSYEGAVDDAPQVVALGDFEFTVLFVDPWAPAGEQQTTTHGGLLMQLGPEEFLVAGSGVALEVAAADPKAASVGIESIWEGRYIGGRWSPGRLLNGDESHQGRRVMLPRQRFDIQRVKLYRYR